jgi:hypothetical protein
VIRFKVLSKFHLLGKQKTDRLQQQEAAPLPSYLSQPAVELRPAELPVIRFGKEAEPAATPLPPVTSLTLPTSAAPVKVSSTHMQGTSASNVAPSLAVALPSTATTTQPSSKADSSVGGSVQVLFFCAY